jgi:hypothetical protein
MADQGVDPKFLAWLKEGQRTNVQPAQSPVPSADSPGALLKELRSLSQTR